MATRCINFLDAIEAKSTVSIVNHDLQCDCGLTSSPNVEREVIDLISSDDETDSDFEFEEHGKIVIDLLDSSDDEESLSTDKDLENLIRKTGNMSISVPSDKENISNKENNKGKTKKTFEKQRESLTKELFSKFNRTVFDGKLEI